MRRWSAATRRTKVSELATKCGVLARDHLYGFRQQPSFMQEQLKPGLAGCGHHHSRIDLPFSSLARTTCLSLLLFLWLGACVSAVAAQRGASATAPPFTVRADRPSAIYKQGEVVSFMVQLTTNSPVAKDAELAWKISKDGVAPMHTGTLKLAQGTGKVTAKLDEPGHLLCNVSATVKGRPVAALGGAAVDPLQIKPSLPVPDDFDAFWAEQKQKLATVPMNARVTSVRYASTNAECFDVQADCAGGAPMSGRYAKPAGAKPRSLPAILLVQGAGVNSSSLASAVTWAERGFLAMDINAHGLPNGKPAPFYSQLSEGALKGYPHFGRESRDTCYFLGMFLRVIRAIDFLAAQPEWDGKTVVVYGSSQGGFQAFAAGGLDERVSFIAAGVPAGCDHTGVVVGRVNGWPKLVPGGPDGKPDPKVLQVSRYFDNVNFATRTKAKGAFVTVGFIDQTCPATTVYAAYNSLKIPKKIYNDIPTGHANSPEATHARNQAVLNYVKSVKPAGAP